MNLFWLADIRDTSTAEAAAIYAAHGWAVFPCAGKQPLVEGGFRSATTDAEQVAAWWTQHPTANIGLPVTPGLWVLDVDGDEGAATLRSLIREHGALPLTLEAETGSGGQHRIFAGDGRQSARFAAGLDTRAAGKGYIIAAPSVHPATRRPYRWTSIAAPVAAPAWLTAMVAPRQERPRQAYKPPAAGTLGASRRERYARAAMTKIAAEVAAAPSGVRNDALNRAWYRLAQFRDVLDQAEARAVLSAAASAAGLGDGEIAKVLR